MKVGLCLAGHMRTAEQVYGDWHKSLFAHYDVDVFLSTWKENDKFGPKEGLSEERIREMFCAGGICEVKIEDYEEKKQMFIDMAAPAQAWLRELMPTAHTEWLRKIHPDTEKSLINVLSQQYKWWRANEMKRETEREKGFVYDVVIRSRPDLHLSGPVNLDVGENEVLVARGGHDNAWVNDVFIAGRSEVMDKVCSLFPAYDYPKSYYKSRLQRAIELKRPELIFDMHVLLGDWLLNEVNVRIDRSKLRAVGHGWSGLQR